MSDTPQTDTTIAVSAYVSGDKFLQQLAYTEITIQNYGQQIELKGRAGELSADAYAAHAAKYNALTDWLYTTERSTHELIATSISTYAVRNSGPVSLSTKASGLFSQYGADALIAMMPSPERLPVLPATLAELRVSPSHLSGLGDPVVVGIPLWAIIVIGIAVLLVIIAVAVAISGPVIQQIMAQRNTVTAYTECLKTGHTPEYCTNNIPDFFQGGIPWWMWVITGGALVATVWVGYKAYKGQGRGSAEPQKWALPAGTSGYGLEV